MSSSRLEVVESLEAVDRSFGLGKSRKREGGDGEGLFWVVGKKLRGKEAKVQSFVEGRKIRRGKGRTRLMRSIPMKDLGRPTSWMGIRENPERLKGEGEETERSEVSKLTSRPRTRSTQNAGSQDPIEHIVIQDGITRKSNNVADRSHDC